MNSKFVCPVENCQKSYLNNSILKRHIQAFHTNSGRFQCTICRKCLASQQNLKEHSYTHTGEKPYICTFEGCGARFRQGTHLSSHKKNFHTEEEIIFSSSDSPNKLDPFTEGSPLNTRIEEKQETINIPKITKPYTCTLPNIFN